MTLLEVVTAGDREAARKLLDEGSFADEGGPGGITPLMAAAARGDAELVDLLLARGADPRLRDEARDTALLKAAAHGHGHLFTALSKGADDDELDMARAFLRTSGFDPAAVPVALPPEQQPSKTKRAMVGAVARAASFFGDEVPEKRLERAERSENRGQKKR